MFVVPTGHLVEYMKNGERVRDPEKFWARVRAVIPEIEAAGVPLDIPEWAMKELEKGLYGYGVISGASIVALPIKNSNEEYAVYVWTTKDGGADWAVLDTTPGADIFRRIWWWWMSVGQTPTPENKEEQIP
jgi:hypothetical protein